MAIVFVVTDEVRVHWRAYSIRTNEMLCRTELRFYDITIGQGNESMSTDNLNMCIVVFIALWPNLPY